MFGRILAAYLLSAVYPSMAGVIITWASASAGPFNKVATDTVINAPMSSTIVSWTTSGGGSIAGSFNLVFPAVSVPDGTTITQLVLWVQPSTSAQSTVSTTVTPVLATCGDVPCPFHAEHSSPSPGGPYGWYSYVSLSGIGYWSNNHWSPTLVDITPWGPAVTNGTPFTMSASWLLEYDGQGEFIPDSGYNAITKTTFATTWSPALRVNIEVHYAETVPEPGTGALFSIAMICVAGYFTRRRFRHRATR